MSTWIGKTLEKVQIDSLIARGGMAVVYLGRHKTLQRDVVVKILRNDFEEDAASLERFQREAYVVAKLRHPNIIQILDFDTIEDQPYIVMEYVAGPSLSRYLNALHKRLGRLELPQVNQILTKIASALQYAHESGVIHRDVKPANILLTSRSGPIIPGEPLPADVEPILTDFGLVRFLRSSLQTSAGKIIGTPAYMSPEQALGENTDERTDIYSLGIVLYEMLAGHVPFDGETTMGILLKHINEPPPPIPGLAFGFQYLLDRALEKKPEKRFQTPNELATAFQEVMEETSGASTIVPITPRKRKTEERAPSRRKWMQAILSTVVLGAMGAFFFLNGRSSPPPSDTPTPTNSAVSETPTRPISISSPVLLGPTGLVRFQDGNAILDQVSITARAMSAPPEGYQYEAWLVSTIGDDRLNLGVLSLDESGQGTLTYTDAENRNLLALYDGIEIVVKPLETTDTNGVEQVAYSYTLPNAGLQYARQLMVSSSIVPQEVALVQGISANSQVISKTAEEMLSAYDNGDQAAILKNAEAILNLLVGSESPQYKDWDADGHITDPGDRYGFLINVNNLGYIQALYSYADYVAHSLGASQNMISNGEQIKICAQNLAQWTSQLRDHALSILNSDSADVSQPVRDSAAIAVRMLNGQDQDNDGVIEPVAGECGVLSSYEYTYRIVDMPLLPVNLLETPSPTPTFSLFAQPTRTPVRQPNDNPSPQNTAVRPTAAPPTSVRPTSAPPTSAPPVPPDKPQPTKKPPKPTNTPKK